MVRTLTGAQAAPPPSPVAAPAAPSPPAPKPKPAKPAPKTWMPPGHFYSPIVDPEQLRRRADQVFNPDVDIPGVELNLEGQLALFRELAAFYPDLKLEDYSPGGPRRYNPQNDHFAFGDAIILATMIRRFRPRRIIEVGSGDSSCVTLDVNERFFDGRIDCTFVEPYPELLNALIRPGERKRIRLIEKGVQEVETSVFAQLQAGDFLFIDSTHVAKADSDVVHHIFRILPSLQDGVIIHFHDIFWPFEYPPQWFFEQNRSWNEQYLLRAFLMHNERYEVLFFNSQFARHHAGVAAELMPNFLLNTGGSFWMRKVAPPTASPAPTDRTDAGVAAGLPGEGPNR